MIRKIIPFFMIVTLVLTAILPSTYSANSGQVFTDVSQDHWAAKFITKMKIRNVIDGYTDQTFRPNQGIDQAQAVSMVVRFLGYEVEAEALRDIEVSEDNELYSYVQNVQSWAKGYVLVAARLGLISNVSSAGFNPREEASRAWMAKLLITSIQKHGTISTNTNSLTFNDSEKIPSWARDEVNIATNLNIITGYTDGTFKPDRAVTRAEMTALLSKSEEFISLSYLKDVVRGKIEVKQNDSLIIDQGENELVKILKNDSAVLYQGNNKISFSQLKTTDEISAVTNKNNEIVYLDLLSTGDRKINEIEGKVYLNDITKKLLTIEDEKQSLLSYKVTEDTVVIKNNSTINLNEIKLYDKVKLTIEESEIAIIEVTDAYEDQSLAEVVSINIKERVITARYVDKSYEVISLADQIKIYDQQGGHVGIEQLNVGDKIILIFQQEKVASIQIPLSYLDGYEITKYRSGKLTLSKNGVEEEYEYGSDLKVTISGYVEPTMNDVEIGDIVKATIYNDKIIALELLNREKKVYLLVDVDTSAKALKVRDTKTNQLSYVSYENTVLIYKDYSLLDSVSKLSNNDRVALSIRDGKVLRIDLAVSQNYTITEIDQASNLVRLKDFNNISRAFYYTDQSIIKVNNTNSFIANFSVNDRVNVYKIGNEILEISK